jgi:ATP-dependent Zn protease
LLRGLSHPILIFEGALNCVKDGNSMNENKPANPWAKSLMIWMAVLFGLVMLSQMFGNGRAAPAGSIPYSEFVKDVNEGNVQSVTIAPSMGGRGAVELLDDHADQLAALHHHSRDKLLRNAPDAEE